MVPRWSMFDRTCFSELVRIDVVTAFPDSSFGTTDVTLAHVDSLGSLGDLLSAPMSLHYEYLTLLESYPTVRTLR